ncbi:unnamed protein product [Nippostrongylus brasiliensis]|uniref:G_PROTEIN_RECEP_F1_2 domain-containing protein n=1 Tax=Nippostrongylus brasiliensis TaxID=27835 RepID=A0A0N4YLN5_NIPBR|nr:unnamed protein product [Nippostrongylus brasiliensis]
MMTVFLFYCIEAIGVLFLNTNLMYNHQLTNTRMFQTMLVIYITFLRFMVVMRPLRYAPATYTRNFKTVIKFKLIHDNFSTKQRKSSVNDHDSCVGSQRGSGRVSFKSSKELLPLRKYIRSCLLPGLVVFLCFAVNIPVYFEFTVERCFDQQHGVEASCPAPTVFRHSFTRYKAILMTLTQTVGPVVTILVLSVLTEYRVHRSLKKRKKEEAETIILRYKLEPGGGVDEMPAIRSAHLLYLPVFRLFESQQRSRSIVLTEESKEKVSRTVAIFIAVKFLIFRSMPVFFDVYENLYGIESFGVALSILVRISDFMIVLNSATNSLAYFGKKRLVEKIYGLRNAFVFDC